MPTDAFKPLSPPPIFDRSESTLGIMDDLQIAIHSYDGCGRGCSGCLVDKHFKNQKRGELILTDEQMILIHSKVLEYYQWCKDNLNPRERGYFKKTGYQVQHFSYTFRFGNHSELGAETLTRMSRLMNAPYQVFSVAPFEKPEELNAFIEARDASGSRFYLEIIYDPIHDAATTIAGMIEQMRKHQILGYPEVLITQRLLHHFGAIEGDLPSIRLAAEKFVKEALSPLQQPDGEGVQVQFGRYSPSKTRNFNKSQMVPLDLEVEWLARVAESILQERLNLHPIPLGEYAVTLLDEYSEDQIHSPDTGVDEVLWSQREPEPFDFKDSIETSQDIFRTSLYIDHNLDVYVWSESMGQHVLDSNFGFEPLGNLRDSSIAEMTGGVNGKVDRMARETVRHLMTHPKCGPCRYKGFCASHALPFFRKWQDDVDSLHCYGYLPVIRQYQRDPGFLRQMIDGFKNLGF